jgi:glutaredoxin
MHIKVYRLHDLSTGHVCAYGEQAIQLLVQHQLPYDDHRMSEHDDAEYKRKHEVTTTPQIWVNGNRIGGYQALCDWIESRDNLEKIAD